MKNNRKVIFELHQKLLAFSVQGQLTKDPEKVHNFRVTYKKLRALLRLLRNVSPKNNKIKLPENLKNIYRRLGRIGDWQLLRSRLLRHPSAGKLNVLTGVIKGYISSQQKIVDEIPFKKMLLSSRNHLSDHLHDSAGPVAVELFLDQKWRTLRDLSSVNLFVDEHVHRFRKVIKDIYYLINLAPSIGVTLYANGSYPGNNKEGYITLMKELGDYNDLCIAINHLASIAWRDPEVVEPIIKDWIDRKHSWLPELHDKILRLEVPLDGTSMSSSGTIIYS
jgi:CHAD domain-containing protein